jgi:hypothetical protein
MIMSYGLLFTRMRHAFLIHLEVTSELLWHVYMNKCEKEVAQTSQVE